MPLGLLVLAVLGGMFWFESTADRRLSLEGLERKIGISNPIQNRLADRFDDAHGNLVADPPKNPKDFLDPAGLTFSYIPGEHPENQKKIWRKWCDDLAKATGKRVEYLPIAKVEDQLNALKEGRLHVAGLNTGAVPTAVDDCGFVPLCTLGRDDNSFGYSMLLIVPAKSPIENPTDPTRADDRLQRSGFELRPQALPIVALLNEFDLRPTRDYDWHFTYEHENANPPGGSRKVHGRRSGKRPNGGPHQERREDQGSGCPRHLQVALLSRRRLSAASIISSPELVAKIKSVALLALRLERGSWSDGASGRRRGNAIRSRFPTVKHSAPVRQIDDTMGVQHRVE